MHQLAMRVSMAAATTIAAAALSAPGPALGRPSAATSKRAFSGNLCGVSIAADLAAVNITAPCVRGRTTRKATRTRLGSVTTETFVSHWGSLPGSGVGHLLTVGAARVTGSPAALAYGRTKQRALVLEHGVLVTPAVGGGPLATEFGDTSSCFNPPKEDCTHASVLALVKNYVVEVILFDYPPTGVGVADPGEDEPQDRAQEETDKAPIVSIFKAVAAKL
jgi:hypothetical protein